jgi:hypothetical protein
MVKLLCKKQVFSPIQIWTEGAKNAKKKKKNYGEISFIP